LSGVKVIRNVSEACHNGVKNHRDGGKVYSRDEKARHGGDEDMADTKYSMAATAKTNS
jgi:hypothetical protein